MPQRATPPRRPTGRPRRSNTVDWDAAEGFYLALNPPRKFRTVGAQFTVSPSRVSTVARQRNWLEKAAAIDQEAAAGARKRIVRSRTDRVAKSLGIVDNWLDELDQALTARVVEIRVSDMPGLVKLAELLEGEATDRFEAADVQAIVAAVFTVAGVWVVSTLPPEERRDGFRADLDAALGGLLMVEQRAAAA